MRLIEPKKFIRMENIPPDIKVVEELLSNKAGSPEKLVLVAILSGVRKGSHIFHICSEGRLYYCYLRTNRKNGKSQKLM